MPRNAFIFVAYFRVHGLKSLWAATTADAIAAFTKNNRGQPPEWVRRVSSAQMDTVAYLRQVQWHGTRKEFENEIFPLS